MQESQQAELKLRGWADDILIIITDYMTIYAYYNFVNE